LGIALLFTPLLLEKTPEDTFLGSDTPPRDELLQPIPIVDPIPYSGDKEALRALIDHSVLEEIAYCESGMRQFNEDGSVLRGRVNPLDTGIFQINSYYWGEEAEGLGFDIESTQGNIDMAKWIYETAGSTPWRHSSGCHHY